MVSHLIEEYVAWEIFWKIFSAKSIFIFLKGTSHIFYPKKFLVKVLRPLEDKGQIS